MSPARMWPGVRRAAFALAGAMAWLPLCAAFVVPPAGSGTDTTLWIVLAGRVLLVAFAALSLQRPDRALLVLAAFVWIADLVAGQFGFAGLRGPETLALAFIGGWLLSLAARPSAAPPAPGTLRAATGTFVGLIVASVIVTLAGLQAQTTFPSEYAARFARFVLTGYLSDPGEFAAAALHGAWLIEGAALLFAARAIGLRDPAWRDGCVRMLIAGAAAAGLLAVDRLARALLTQLNPRDVFALVMTGEWRLPAHVSDTNAASSGFIMAALVSIGYILSQRRRQAIGWTGPLAAILIGLLISGSRTAIVGGLIVVTAFAVVALRRRGGLDLRKVAVGGLVAVLAIAGAIVRYAPNLMAGRKGLVSLAFRWYFTQTSLKIMSLAPVFGVGLARYRELSPAYMPAPLLEVYRAENAHNYFLQIGAELGLVGLLLFAIVAWTPVVRGLRALVRGIDFTSVGLVCGALVFLITAMTGHPFLTSAVTLPFWIVLGLCEADSETRAGHAAPVEPGSGPASRLRRPAIVTALACTAIALTLPARIDGERRYVDFTRVAYGVYEWEESDAGFRYRWTGPDARLFVPSSARLVEIPVRALHFGGAARRTDVAIALDGRDANHLSLADANWQVIRLLVPPSRGLQFRRIDLHVSPTWSPARVTPGADDTRELGVIIGEVKVTKLSDSGR